VQDPRRTDTAPGSGRSGPASAAFESPLHAGAEAERGCEAVGSVDGSPGGPGARPAAAPGQSVGQAGAREQTCASGGVERHHDPVVREDSGEVDGRPGGRRHGQTADVQDLVVVEVGDVHGQHSAGVVPRGWPAGDVEPVEWDAPERLTTAGRRS
jgi:hypothetical protein